MLREFELFQAKSTSRLLNLVGRHTPRARIIAGGTALLVDMKRGVISPDVLLSIREVPPLRRISFHPNEGLHLGAAVTIREIENSPVIRQHYPLLVQAASRFGSYQIRSQATIGGNLCHASPAGDMIPAVIALDGQLTLSSPAGSRTVAGEAFFAGPGKTVMAEQEVLTGIAFPPAESGLRAAFVKFSRRECVDLAIVNVAVMIRLNEDRRCEHVRISLGAVGPTVMRARLAEADAMGARLDDHMIQALGDRASQEVEPLSDIRASAAYRKAMSRVVTVRALRAALESHRAGGHPDDAQRGRT